jgi:hypothetical protein
MAETAVVAERTAEESRFLVNLYQAAASGASARLYGVGKELGKRPVLRELVEDVAASLDGLQFSTAWAFERMADGRCEEDVINDVLAEGPLWRMSIPDNTLQLEEIVVRRRELDSAWDRFESEEHGGEGEEYTFTKDHELMDKSNDLRGQVLKMIATGCPNPVEIAKAVLGSERIQLEGDAS